jgi:hypothetical protein
MAGYEDGPKALHLQGFLQVVGVEDAAVALVLAAEHGGIAERYIVSERSHEHARKPRNRL